MHHILYLQRHYMTVLRVHSHLKKRWGKLSCKLSLSYNLLFCSILLYCFCATHDGNTRIAIADQFPRGPVLLSITFYFRVKKLYLLVCSKILTVVVVFIREIIVPRVQNLTSQRYFADTWRYSFLYLLWFICGDFKFHSDKFWCKNKNNWGVFSPFLFL